MGKGWGVLGGIFGRFGAFGFPFKGFYRGKYNILEYRSSILNILEYRYGIIYHIITIDIMLCSFGVIWRPWEFALKVSGHGFIVVLAGL